jgi:hypothetical protein
MSSLLNKAVAGASSDEEARRVLLVAGVDGLKRMAGGIPEKTKAKVKKRDLKEAKVYSERIQSQVEYHSDVLERMNDYRIWQGKLPRINGIEQMPTIPIVRMDSYLHEAFEFSKGRAWLAGSAALWTTVDDIWRYGDIDLFAYSSESYEALLKGLISRLTSVIRSYSKELVLTRFPLSTL